MSNSIRYSPEELLKLLILGRSVIKVLYKYIDEQKLTSVLTLFPDSPETIIKQFEYWIVYVEEGIRIAEEKKQKELEEAEKEQLY